MSPNKKSMVNLRRFRTESESCISSGCISPGSRSSRVLFSCSRFYFSSSPGFSYPPSHSSDFHILHLLVHVGAAVVAPPAAHESAAPLFVLVVLPGGCEGAVRCAANKKRQTCRQSPDVLHLLAIHAVSTAASSHGINVASF